MTQFEEYKEAVTGITAGYAFNDGVNPRVPYSFMGSIYDDDERQLLLSVLQQDALTMGPQVGAFQKEFANWFGVKHAFATTSCTTAMHVATQALGIKEGDEVIVTPNTFIATTLVILKEGGIPIYADIDPRTYNIDPEQIKRKVTKKTKAIFIVHYAGQMCDMDPIMEIAKEHGLAVMEDCAHAHGSEYKGRKAGAVGDIGCFSFHSLKNMSLGEGGMITTNRDDLVDAISKLRNMNITEWEDNPHTEYWLPSHFDVKDVDGKWGVNYRMTEFQAAIGRCQLRKLPELVRRRQENGRYLSEGLKDVEGYVVPYEDPNCKHSYHLYTLCVDPRILDRDEVMRDIYYRQRCTQGILHYQPSYDLTGVKKYLEARGYGGQFCPVAHDFFYKREFNLPMNPRLTREELDIMIGGLRAAADRVGK
jgi:dTDP-4-amino-4,6-dideoxygalactose transaminase